MPKCQCQNTDLHSKSAEQIQYNSGGKALSKYEITWIFWENKAKYGHETGNCEWHMKVINEDEEYK